MSTDTMQFDSSLNITGNLSAKRMLFGTRKCNISIETVIEGDKSYPEMYITLPNTYHGYRVYRQYRMRSIIESIQELNRRTATFACNTSFDSAKKQFETAEDPYGQFACNDHKDGLPAATNGELLTERILNLDHTDSSIEYDDDGNVLYINIGIWTYTVLSKDTWCTSKTGIFTNLKYKVLNCRLNTDAFNNTLLNKSECVIDYNDSPYDRIFIYNDDGSHIECRTCMYRRALSADLLLSTNVTTMTLKNWNNKYVEVMTGMFENRYDNDSGFAYRPDSWTMPTDTAFGVTSNVYLYSHVGKHTNPFTCTYGNGILTVISFENFNTSFVGRIDRMFYGLFALRSIDLNGFSDLNRVWKINDFVKQCGIEGIDMSRFTLYPGSYDTNIRQEGIHCYVSANGTPYATYTGVDVAEVNYSIRDMFFNCYLLTSLKFPNVDNNISTDSDTVGLFNGIGTEIWTDDRRNPTPFLKEFELDYTMYSIFVNAKNGGSTFLGTSALFYYNDITLWKNINGYTYRDSPDKHWININSRQILTDPSPLEITTYSA